MNAVGWEEGEGGHDKQEVQTPLLRKCMMHFYRESQFYIEVVQKKLMVWGVGGRRDNKQMLGILFLHEKNTIYDYHFISVEKLPIAILSPLSNFLKKYMRCTSWTLMIENINKYTLILF